MTVCSDIGAWNLITNKHVGLVQYFWAMYVAQGLVEHYVY